MADQLLRDRVAVVTGASKGLGKAMAVALAQAGATVALVARSGELLRGVKAEIDAAGGKSHVAVADLREESEVARMAEQVRCALGSPDILINNAGMNLRKPLQEFTLEEWRLVLQTNLDTAFLCSRAFVPGMIEKHFGRVISIASTMAHVAMAHRTAYCASKFGVLGMTKALALELAPHGITANTISPGPFATEMTSLFMQDPVRNAQFLSHIPVGRWGQAEEIGPLAAFLCSEAAGFITGADILIDGGWTAQ